MENGEASSHDSASRLTRFKNLGRQEMDLREKRRESAVNLRKMKRDTDVRSARNRDHIM